MRASCFAYSKLNLKKKERKGKITKILQPSSLQSCEPGSEEGQDTREGVGDGKGSCSKQVEAAALVAKETGTKGSGVLKIP